MATDPKVVALWMLEQLNQKKELYQSEAVTEIETKFGKAFIYENQQGNLAISKQVLTEFRKLTENSAVWVRGDRCWRLRHDYDLPGRRQD